MTSPGRDKPPPFVAVRGPCDLSCAWCNYAGVAPVDASSEVARVTGELERLSESGATGVGFGFLHSEPTTHPDFVEIVGNAAALGFKQITLSTSGLRIADPDILERLGESGITGVVLSFAGLDPEIGDLLLGRAGATAAKLRALDNCVAAGLSVDVILMFLRPVLPQMPHTVLTLGQRTAAARDRVSVHGALMDPVAGMPDARTQTLWPTYGEVAWTMARVRERVPDFALQARYVPPCVRDTLAGLRIVDYDTSDRSQEDGAFTKIDSACVPCPEASSCRGVQAPHAVHGAALLSAEPVAPAAPDIAALAEVLRTESASPGPTVWSLATPTDAWPAAVARAIAGQLAGETALWGYRLRGFDVRGDELWVGLRDLDDDVEMNAIVEERDRAQRYYAKGKRFVISYATGTPPLTDEARRLLYALLEAAEAS